MFDVLSNQVFPFLRGLQASGGPAAESAFAAPHARCRFTIPTPGLLAKVVDLLDTIPLDDRDTKGDLYEYMLGKSPLPGKTASSARRATSSI